MNIIPSSEQDRSASIQQALDEMAQSGGGRVVLAAGHYRLDSSINVPTGVSLEGSWAAPHHGILAKGTVLMIYAGRGDETKAPAIELAASSAVRNLTICYPSQKLDAIESFPWTIHGTGMHPTAENITLVNSYNGIAMERHELHLIRNVFGCVLRRGILIDGCTDIGRIENVHFNPHYWHRSGHGGVPNDAQPNPDLAVALYMQTHLEAFIFGRSDWQYVLNTFVFGAKIGYHFVDNGPGACNGNFIGIGADACRICLLLDKTQPMGIQILNGEFVNLPLRPEDDDGNWTMIRTTENFKQNLQLTNCTFWGRTNRIVDLIGPGTVTMCQGNARGWRDDGKDVPFVIHRGRFTLKDYNLAGKAPHFNLHKNVESAIIADNFCDVPLVITGEGRHKAILRDNQVTAAEDGR
ncbi:hypothetical protein JXJ21_15190 [candidate division KSB1 bacterium]|nr:hypothetical protein [candidate division KSB1 bacterium]